MALLEPALLRLKHAAYTAGQHKASWTSYLLASHEALTKCVGRGAFLEELQPARCYEVARRHLFKAWARGAKGTPLDGNAPAVPTVDQQQTFFPTSHPYQ